MKENVYICMRYAEDFLYINPNLVGKSNMRKMPLNQVNQRQNPTSIVRVKKKLKYVQAHIKNRLAVMCNLNINIQQNINLIFIRCKIHYNCVKANSVGVAIYLNVVTKKYSQIN